MPIKNILYWVKIIQWVTAHTLKDVDDNDGVYLTTACYTMEEQVIKIWGELYRLKIWSSLWSVMNLLKEYYTPWNYKTQCRFRVFTKCTHTCNTFLSNSVWAADCSDISPCWCQRQLHHSLQRLSVLSNVTSCKYKHNDKITSHPYRDTCTAGSRETTIFSHVNTLNHPTFLQFLSTIHHPEWSILTGSTTLWKSWKVDEETWTMLGLSNCYPQRNAKM